MTTKLLQLTIASASRKNTMTTPTNKRKMSNQRISVDQYETKPNQIMSNKQPISINLILDIRHPMQTNSDCLFTNNSTIHYSRSLMQRSVLSFCINSSFSYDESKRNNKHVLLDVGYCVQTTIGQILYDYYSVHDHTGVLLCNVGPGDYVNFILEFVKADHLSYSVQLQQNGMLFETPQSISEFGNFYLIITPKSVG